MKKTLLCVAEKPNVAATASSILSKGTAHPEIIQAKPFNLKNYYFHGRFLGQNVNVIFTAVAGHLFQINFSGDYSKWNGVNPNDLFTAPIVTTVPPEYTDIQRNLERLSKKANFLMLWLDNDREGENIS